MEEHTFLQEFSDKRKLMRIDPESVECPSCGRLDYNVTFEVVLLTGASALVCAECADDYEENRDILFGPVTNDHIHRPTRFRGIEIGEYLDLMQGR